MTSVLQPVRSASLASCWRRAGSSPALSSSGGRRLNRNVRAAASGDLGLRSMAERIQTAGGELELSSRPYQGTQVVLRLPG